ncbi:uncharacterized protein FTOL_09224 [Fusarium torulosum]|uniref:2EXR domain-containing protein n=1 Tax=Fusarium torulosum TaxID=33205 RepID=A0AAE8MFK3_9HYPO|nr:uncharacterized protein FTOL_09224 [Fusarium torulosum]
MSDSFQYFKSLPVELQREIWCSAVRPTNPGVQIFSLRSDDRSQSHEDGAQEAPWADTYYLTAPQWAFSPGSNQFSSFDEATASWTENNPSTYLIDSGLWNACSLSRRVMRDKLGPTQPIMLRTRVSYGSCNVEASTSESVVSQQRSIIVTPSQDLFILQLDYPYMFNWSLFDDFIPDDRLSGPMPMRHVGWQYHPTWASSLRESPWIGSLHSLCCYIVYGVRFRGLERMWLMNYRIKRKNWVPTKEQLGGSELKVFETDKFRLTEVLDEGYTRLGGSSELLRWDEVTEEGDPHTLDDFLAFVHQLRHLVTHTLLSTPALEAAKRTMSVKILAYEER